MWILENVRYKNNPVSALRVDYIDDAVIFTDGSKHYDLYDFSFGVYNVLENSVSYLGFSHLYKESVPNDYFLGAIYNYADVIPLPIYKFASTRFKFTESIGVRGFVFFELVELLIENNLLLRWKSDTTVELWNEFQKDYVNRIEILGDRTSFLRDYNKIKMLYGDRRFVNVK